MNEVLKAFKVLAARIRDDHVGAYAAMCAYFLIISFVPFITILIALSRRATLDSVAFIEGLISVIPAGLTDYVTTIIDEVYAKPQTLLPVSLLILTYSASKAVHALTNGLNVISHVEETRGWFFLRFRSMILVILTMVIISVVLQLNVYGTLVRELISVAFPWLGEFIETMYPFRSLFAYFGLLIVFVMVYKFVPNCHYTFRSQLPGALVVATIWSFFSYLMSLYYTHNQNFLDTYGSLTGIILAMIWLFFCMLFLLVGAEMNRIIYEDPENNVFVSTGEKVQGMSDARRRRVEDQIAAEQAQAHRRRVRKANGGITPDDDRDMWDDLDINDYERMVRRRRDVRPGERGGYVVRRTGELYDPEEKENLGELLEADDELVDDVSESIIDMTMKLVEEYPAEISAGRESKKS